VFYEAKQNIKLPFTQPKFIEIPVDRLIFLEIGINSNK